MSKQLRILWRKSPDHGGPPHFSPNPYWIGYIKRRCHPYVLVEFVRHWPVAPYYARVFLKSRKDYRTYEESQSVAFRFECLEDAKQVLTAYLNAPTPAELHKIHREHRG